MLVKIHYDSLGRRASKVVNGVTTAYLLDGDEEIAEYSGPTLLRRYIVGPAIDDRIAHVEGSLISAPPKTYYHVNHQGSVMAMTDLTGNVSQRLAYDEYGQPSSGTSGIGEPFQYTGRRFDSETGLYYYRARYYSPQLGRFLQTDPVGYRDDVDLYTYVDNDSLDKTDPSGRIAEVLPVIIVVAAGLSSGCASIPSCTQSITDTLSNIGNSIQSSFDRFKHFALGPEDPNNPANSSPDENNGASSSGTPDPDDPEKTDYAKKRQAERKVSDERVSEALRKGSQRPSTTVAGRTTYDLSAKDSASGRGVRIVVEDSTGKVINIIDKGSTFVAKP